ncbi:MAG: AbrB/MazE/SpoVT family DNA-binding domain-containing protein [Natrialbaceae archaeon]|nr:AbrB/MazE/SpoVT family DNA-binding domain-containing protein [Natrialbaceae archaeon]
MGEMSLDDRGRLTVPKALRERYGEHFHLVPLHDGIKLVPIADDPLIALREEFKKTDKSAADLRDDAREQALEDAGR